MFVSAKKEKKKKNGMPGFGRQPITPITASFVSLWATKKGSHLGISNLISFRVKKESVNEDDKSIGIKGTAALSFAINLKYLLRDYVSVASAKHQS